MITVELLLGLEQTEKLMEVQQSDAALNQCVELFARRRLVINAASVRLTAVLYIYSWMYFMLQSSNYCPVKIMSEEKI